VAGFGAFFRGHGKTVFAVYDKQTDAAKRAQINASVDYPYEAPTKGSRICCSTKRRKPRSAALPPNWSPMANGPRILAELLPVPYFHVVYTLPSELRDIAYQNKRVVYDLLMKAAAETTLTIAADPKRLGARIGITTVLHT
jgi:hypothetical protein